MGFMMAGFHSELISPILQVKYLYGASKQTAASTLKFSHKFKRSVVWWGFIKSCGLRISRRLFRDNGESLKNLYEPSESVCLGVVDLYRGMSRGWGFPHYVVTEGWFRIANSFANGVDVVCAAFPSIFIAE